MNNDQNNLNQVGTITPNPTPVSPEPIGSSQGNVPANTIVAGPVPVPPAPTIESAPVSSAEPVQPVPPADSGIPVAPAPVSPVPPAPVGPEVTTPAAPVNLQPEGIVAPPPVNNDVNSGVVEPLMSTSLNDVTSFQQPASITDTNVLGVPVPPAANNQIGNIGGIPTPPPLPTEADAKPKKGVNKILIIVLAVVLVLGVGFGIYYFLVLAKDKDKSMTPILNTVELGSFLDTSLVPNFVSLKGYTSSECSVTTNLNTSVFGTYEYTVTCGKNSISSKVDVKDTKAPEVTLREVAVVPGTVIKPEDFVASSNDASDITYNFETQDDYSNLDEGSYDVNIIASDAYDNNQIYTGKLIIDANAPDYYVACISLENERPYQTSYIFGISSDGSIYNVVEKNEWIYSEIGEYQNAVASYRSSNSLDGVSGDASFDPDSKIISIETSVTIGAMSSTLGFDDEPTTEDDLDDLFEGNCSVID